MHTHIHLPIHRYIDIYTHTCMHAYSLPSTCTHLHSHSRARARTHTHTQVDKTKETTYYDSVTGKPLFIAPRGRSFEAFVKESKVN
jgi:hypothetical protein